jgi:hypothetical protein
MPNENENPRNTSERPILPLWPDVGRNILGLGKDAAYSAAKKGQIPAIKLGNRLFVTRAALGRLLEGQSEES